MLQKLFAGLLAAIMVAALIRLYDLFPDQRAIFVLATIFSAALGGCASCRKRT